MSLLFVADPNSLIAALRSLDEGVTPAFANNVSTNCVGVMEVGNAAVNRERWTNSDAKACLLFSKTVSQPVCPTTTPLPISCVSGKNSLNLIGTGALGRLP